MVAGFPLPDRLGTRRSGTPFEQAGPQKTDAIVYIALSAPLDLPSNFS